MSFHYGTVWRLASIFPVRRCVHRHLDQDSVRALLSIYPTGVEDLFPRRSNAINAASEMRWCLRYIAVYSPFSLLYLSEGKP